MNSPAPTMIDAARCPLCGLPNDCQLCSVAAYKGPCWCASVKIPEELIARIPPEARNKACLCRACVMKYHREQAHFLPVPKILPGDFYFDGAAMVFTAGYHLRRGYCCENGCRNCPYRAMPSVAQ